MRGASNKKHVPNRKL